MYGSLLSPRWIVRHLLVLVAIALFALAGVWQIHRHRERTARNAVVAARRAAAEIELAEALRNPSTAEHRRVRASGRYDTSREVVLLGRGDATRPGNHVLTPLVHRGRAVIVDRGWVPVGVEAPPVARAAPPSGNVVVRGELMETERAPLRGARRPTKIVSLIDLRRLADQLPYPVAPFYVLLASQSPPQSRGLPAAVKPRALERGPHVGYAMQWFSFIAIALIGYGAFVRRSLREPAGNR